MNAHTKIVLQVQDDETQVVVTTLEVAQRSILLKGMFEEMDEQVMMVDAIPVYAQDIDLEMLRLTVSFMERRIVSDMKEIQKPLFMTLLKCVGEEDFQTVSGLDFHQLGRLLSVASYLNVPELMELIGARLAEKIRDVTPAQLADSLGVIYRDVISEEEEIDIRRNVEDRLAQYSY